MARNPVLRPKGRWASIRDVEIAVAEHVDCVNHRRLRGEIALVPPVDAEATSRASQTGHEPKRKRRTRMRLAIADPPYLGRANR